MRNIMKRNPNFLLRDVAGTKVIVPVGEAVSAFPGMITVNSTGAYLWELLEQEQTELSLIKALTDRYEVDEKTAKADVTAFVSKLKTAGALI